VNRLAIGLLVGLTGCFPLIPGTWHDYDVPADTLVVGEMWWNEYAGGYWQDDTPSGGVYWGFLDPPQTDRAATELILDGELGCRNGSADISWFLDGQSTEGDGKSTLSGPDNSYTLDWSSDLNVFIDEDLADAPSGPYALDDATTGDATVSVPGSFVDTVEPIHFDTSLIDQDTLQTKVARELSFTWEARDSATDFALVTAILMDDTDAEVERVTCVLPTSDGHVDIDKDLWTKLPDGSYWFVRLGVAHETIGRLVGTDSPVGSRMLYSNVTVGAISKKN
jgi:hypothetical protein